MLSVCSRSDRLVSADSRPENCRQDFTFEEDEDDDVAMRWVEFNHAGPAQVRLGTVGG